MAAGVYASQLPSNANASALLQSFSTQSGLAGETFIRDEVVTDLDKACRVDRPTQYMPCGTTTSDYSPSGAGATDLTETLAMKSEVPGQPDQRSQELHANEKLRTVHYERHFALTNEALHRLTSAVSSVDQRVSEMARKLDERPASSQQLVDTPASRQSTAPSDGGDVAGVKALERVSLALTQQHRDQQVLLTSVQRLQSTVDAIKVSVQQLQEQQQLLQEQCEALVVASANSESFRTPISCYDVAVLSADSLLFATNKGVHEFSADGRELSRFLQNDLVVAIGAFSYDGHVAVLLQGGAEAKARTSSSHDKSNRAVPSHGTQLVIMRPNGAISQPSAQWLEEGRFALPWKVHHLATVPESGGVLVACGMDKPDVYCLTRSAELNFEMKARHDVRALAATVEAVIVASSASRGSDSRVSCCVISAYGDRGQRPLWMCSCVDQVYDLCCDPWGGVYAAVRDGGTVLAINEPRGVPSESQPGSGSAGSEKEGRAATILLNGLTKPAHLAIDGRARRLVVLSYDGRIVNALRCKTKPIKLCTVR